MDTEKELEDLMPASVSQHDIAIDRAQVLMDGQKWDRALVELRRALTVEPESPIGHHLSAICYLYMDEYEKARQETKLTIELYPDFDEAYWILANIALQQEKYSEGLKAIKVALEMDPSDPRYLITKASLLMDSGNSKAALETIEEALRLEPENETAGSLRTMILSSLGRHDEASAQASQVMKAAPDDSMSWYQKGVQLFSQGKMDESRHALLESLRLDPENSASEELLLRVMSAQKGFFSLFWRWTLFMLRFPPAMRYVIFGVLYVLVKIIQYLGRHHPEWSPISIPIVAFWVFFCIYTWTAEPLFKWAVRKGWIK